MSIHSQRSLRNWGSRGASSLPQQRVILKIWANKYAMPQKLGAKVQTTCRALQEQHMVWNVMQIARQTEHCWELKRRYRRLGLTASIRGPVSTLASLECARVDRER